MSSGTATTASVRRVTYSAYPPSRRTPACPRVSDQLVEYRALKILTVDILLNACDEVADAAALAAVAVPPCQPPPTCCPSFHMVSFDGMAATTPTISCPGMRG